MSTVKRIFVEKKPGFDVVAKGLLHDLRDNLGIKTISAVRHLVRYDVEGLSDADYISVRDTIFAEPPVDFVYDEQIPSVNGKMFAIEYVPGQYDQRADSAGQCIQLITHGVSPVVASAQVIIIEGAVTSDEFEKIKRYCINPVDSREASLNKPSSLETILTPPHDVTIMDGFINLSNQQLDKLREEMGFAMRLEDLAFCQKYFKETEKRNPTITELKVLDTYWSDHCRHTTFLTVIDNVEIEQGELSKPIKDAYDSYLKTKQLIGNSKPVCLMDIATIAMKELRKKGKLQDLDESEEINACSIVVPISVDGKQEDWLVMFKNETHNHPTEIEPFGGAATCLGGAIRDPLSGRSYVYQAMRVTGASDPRQEIENTLPGKLPQRKITTLAAQGYSSYGNQIGLATGMVSEIYDEGYVAKRMEIGAVIGAAPKSNVVREKPVPGDIIVLLGGRTGRDGCGGATGSSKEHTEESINLCGAEVQKGNPPTERKIQRLFRDPSVSTLIKRCNDFGAGGVCVAVGELAPGLEINLDAVPKKYEGLDGTELAISESQERMAVVISSSSLGEFVNKAAQENLECAVIATVTAKNRLVMKWRNKVIVDISRDFIDTNGVAQHINVKVKSPQLHNNFFKNYISPLKSTGTKFENWNSILSDLNVCSQRGLVERFDSTIGAGSVFLPFGGKYQITPMESMVAKLPVLHGFTNDGTIMSFGYNPKLSSWSPFHGAVYAIVEAIAKLTCTGGNYKKARLTLQEYFERVGNDPERWGKPLVALLGAYIAQLKLGIAAIGGKDSMSGTFKDLNVPPTLVCFAVAPTDVSKCISPEFKAVGNQVLFIELKRDHNELPEFEQLEKIYSSVNSAIENGSVISAHSVSKGGIAETLSLMSFGNRYGVEIDTGTQSIDFYAPHLGSIVVELAPGKTKESVFGDMACTHLGTTSEKFEIIFPDEKIDLQKLQTTWESVLETVFPSRVEPSTLLKEHASWGERNKSKASVKVARPRVLITVFPGTNCEYDTARAFEKAGAEADIVVMRNSSGKDVEESIDEVAKKIQHAQILMIPGGFSAGDEPEGSGKFIAAFFRNPRIKDAVNDLLYKRDGLGLGICNGFQALIKLGLVPDGQIKPMHENSATLTFNTIGRHISRMAYTKICSVKSPWLSKVEVGDIHCIPISHGEGRFVAPEKTIQELFANGQVVTCYVDPDGDCNGIDANLNGSDYGIEGICSPDGRILGKMGHSERKGENIAKNIYGNKDQLLFESGIAYFS